MVTEKYPKQVLSSYGLLQATSYVCRPKNYDEVLTCIAYAKQHGFKICPSGSRLSFSNVCLADKQIAMDLRDLNTLLQFNEEKKEVTVQAGMLTAKLLAIIMPRGFTLVSLSGSLGNTIAGDISNDVNGKDGFKHGNFGANVVALKIATASGTIIDVNAQNNEELYNSLIGGLGLIGVILEVTLRLKSISSFVVKSAGIRFSSISDLVQGMNSIDPGKTDFAYCWTDPYAPNNSLGRGICEMGAFTEDSGDYSATDLVAGFEQKNQFGPFEPKTFWWLYRKLEFKAAYQIAGYLKYFFNGSAYRQQLFTAYQYPMVKYLPQWNLKYYPLGFREWQILFSSKNFEAAYKTILLLCRQYNFVPYICAVKKHKAQNSYLSFSGDGFSLTVNYALADLKINDRLAFEEELLKTIISLSGKVYIGKTPYFSKPVLEAMYPDAGKFLLVKSKTDPGNLFWSDAAEKILF